MTVLARALEDRRHVLREGHLSLRRYCGRSLCCFGGCLGSQAAAGHDHGQQPQQHHRNKMKEPIFPHRFHAEISFVGYSKLEDIWTHLKLRLAEMSRYWYCSRSSVDVPEENADTNMFRFNRLGSSRIGNTF